MIWLFYAAEKVVLHQMVFPIVGECHVAYTQGMAKFDESSFAALFKVLAHPARIAILVALQQGEQCVCHLEAHLGYKQAYLSQQLAVLRGAHLIADRRRGLNIYYQVIKPEVFTLLEQAGLLLGIDPNYLAAPAPADCPCPICATASQAPLP